MRNKWKLYRSGAWAAPKGSKSIYLRLHHLPNTVTGQKLGRPANDPHEAEAFDRGKHQRSDIPATLGLCPRSDYKTKREARPTIGKRHNRSAAELMVKAVMEYVPKLELYQTHWKWHNKMGKEGTGKSRTTWGTPKIGKPQTLEKPSPGNDIKHGKHPKWRRDHRHWKNPIHGKTQPN